jgi:WD40 repeat protein
MGGLSTFIQAEEPTRITFDDHIKLVFREHCTSCHNTNDKKSGLALDSYQSTMAGGSGGESLVAGDLESSRLYGLTAHIEQPYMPPNQDMIPKPKIDLLKAWIEQGMPENSGSVVKKPKASLAAINVVSVGRPEGAPPMPVSLTKQTPLYTPKSATISAMAASPWSPLVAVGGQAQVSLYHSDTGELLGVIPFPEGEPQSITFSRDGKLILIAGGRHSVDGYAVLHEIATGNRIAKVGDELDIVLSADISEDNRLIALAGPQKMVRVYETLSGKLKYEQKKHTDWIYCVRFSPDGLLLATADRSSGLVVWESQTGRLFLDLAGHKSEIRSVAWRPDSMALVSGSLDGTMKMWDMNEGKVVKSWDAHGGGVAAIAICNDGTMASTGRDNKVKVWDGAGNAAGEMPALAEAGHEIAITVDGKQIAAGDWLGNVRMWQRANPAIESKIPANPLPLELALVESQSYLNTLVANATATQADFGVKQAQLTTLQPELVTVQSQSNTLAAQILTLTQQQSEAKALVDVLPSQIETKVAELAPIKVANQEKTNLLNAASVAKQQADDSTVALQSARTAEGADVAGIDVQIAANTTQSQTQAAAIATIQFELQGIATDIANRDKQIVDMSAILETKKAEFATLSAQLLETTAAKVASDKKMEEITLAIKGATDIVAAAQVVMDGANAGVVHRQQVIANLQADIAKFASLPTELATKRVTLEQSIAAIQVQTQAAAEVVAASKGTVDGSSAEIAKLEQQLVALQTMLAAEQAKRTALQGDLAEKLKLLDTVQTQLMQSESDLGSLQMQQDLFEKAYFKKP